MLCTGFVTSPVTHGRRFLRGSGWKVCSSFFLFPEKNKNNKICKMNEHIWLFFFSFKKKRNRWLERWSTAVFELVLSKRLLYLGTVASSAWNCPPCPQSEGEEKEKTDSPTSRKHMQTCKHNLRGSNKKSGFMSTVTNPQVSSNEHTHWNGEFSLNRHWVSSGKEISRMVLFRCVAGASILFIYFFFFF